MKITSPQLDFNALNQLLERQLQPILQPLGGEGWSVSVGVRCVIKDSTLVVLAQYPPVEGTEPQQVFSTLQDVVQSHLSEFSQVLSPGDQATEISTVRLYLRSPQAERPYAAHTFSVHSAEQVTANPSPSEPSNPSELSKPSNLSPSDPSPPASGALVPNHQAIALEQDAAAPPDASADEIPLLSGSELLEERSRPVAALAVSAVLGLVALLGGGYVLSRPCVIGECLPLKTAEQLNSKSMQTIQAQTSASDAELIYEQLVEASYLLSTIPPWSKYHATAQELLSDYEDDAQILGYIVTAQKQAFSAASASQNPPHPLETWQEIRAGWQGAIAQLQQVPAGSFAIPLAQAKLTEYQANLATINRRIAIEEDAQRKIVSARKTAQLAETRESIADSVEDWQLAHVTWQVVVSQLQNISRHTMADAEAQQLLAIYQPRLTSAGNRRTQEEISSKTYSQAVGLANRARQLETQNQWSQAVASWRDALDNAQQVPTDTTYHDQAQPLVSSYTNALASAEERLRTAVSLQSALPSLANICSGTPQICSYTFAENVIRVSITAEYDQAVEDALADTQRSGDIVAQAGVVAHVGALLRSLAVISDSAQVSIELYNSDGTLVGTYVPHLSGYVPN